jgi:glycosyltransferase involved in cell wall biosynthesis
MAAEYAGVCSAIAAQPRPQPRWRRVPQRVLMTADAAGGVWDYALELSAALLARGHEVVLATMGAMPDRGQRRAAAAIGGLELRPSAYKVPWMDDAWHDVLAAGHWLMDLAAEVRPGVVHLNDFGHANLPWPAPVVLVAHACMASWWRAVHAAPLPPQRLRYRRCVSDALHAADLVVAPSQALLRGLRRHYGPLPGARVIAHGRNGAGLDRAGKGRYVFGAGCADDAGGNIAALHAVAPMLQWPACIAGGERAAHAARAPNVRALGPIGSAHRRRWLAHAAIFALPARYEPPGLAVLEAALAGCALVLGDIDSLREHWDGAAVYAPPDDHAALAAALQRLIGDPARLARLARAARERARRFTPSAMADAYADAYAEIGLGRPEVAAAAAREPVRRTLS